MNMWTKRGSHVGDGITKPSTSVGILTRCHNLDIEKGGATISTEDERSCHYMMFTQYKYTKNYFSRMNTNNSHIFKIPLGRGDSSAV